MSGPRPARGRLSETLIVDTAIALIEREGAPALTMRRLGAELGVEAMSLYHHLRGREELLAAIGDRMLEPLRGLDLTAEPREACRRFAAALRGIALEKPATFRLVGLQPLDRPTSLQAVERLLAVLVGAGLSPSEALVAYRAVASFARGYALAEATGFTVDAARAAGRQRLLALPPEEFPVLQGRAGELVALTPQAGFEGGLEALIAGLALPG